LFVNLRQILNALLYDNVVTRFGNVVLVGQQRMGLLRPILELHKVLGEKAAVVCLLFLFQELLVPAVDVVEVAKFVL
jgi:hypothetical protein